MRPNDCKYFFLMLLQNVSNCKIGSIFRKRISREFNIALKLNPRTGTNFSICCHQLFFGYSIKICFLGNFSFDKNNKIQRAGLI